MNLLFVCTGNTCRSPMCEGYLKHLCEKAGMRTIAVASAGLSAGTGGQPASANAVSAVRASGVDLSGHRNRPLTKKMAEQADLILVMTRTHRLLLGSMLPGALEKTHLLLEFAGRNNADVADPYGGSQETYDACFAEMKQALDPLFQTLIRNQ